MQTLTVMAQLAKQAESDASFHDRINATVRRSLPYTFGDSELDRLDNFVRGHFHYRPEREEVIRTPLFMARELQESGKFEGDCDDVSVMLAVTARLLGYAVRLVAIRNSEHFEHVFVEIYDGERWRVFDPTVQRGTEYNQIERMVVRV